MKKTRVIARLDVKGPNVVKGIQFECLRVLAKPDDLAEEYYLQGADELIYFDIVANLYRRNNLIDIVDKTTERVFIPFTIGGGVRSIEDITLLLKAGADKVAINTTATKNPGLIKKASRMFGSQCIVSSIEAKWVVGKNKWEAYVDNGRQKTGLDAVEWAKQVEQLGAGEIFLTSIDKDGTEKGFDLNLIKAVSEAVSIPVIAAGGAGKPEDLVKGINDCSADAVAIGSILHYKKYDIYGIKDVLSKAGVNIREVKNAKRVETKPDQKPDLVTFNKYLDKQLKEARLEKDGPQGTLVKPKKVNGKADIGVIEYGINNVKSVINAFEKVGRKAKVVESPEEIYSFKALVLPGVGAFENGMKGLEEKGFIKPIKEKVNSGTPLLGICLGMQMLFSESEEFGLCKGFDFIKGKVTSLKQPSEVKMKGYKLPHIGWNELRFPIFDKNGLLWKKSELRNTKEKSYVYFVHSFVGTPKEQESIVATSEYGNQEFCVFTKQGNVSGAQFHPEKSGEIGLAILKSFCGENGL